jgi:ferredoxin-NADP reductase
MAVQTFPVILEEVKSVTPRVRHLAFRRADGQAFDYIPGQFISIHLDMNGSILRRSYSVATIPGQSDLIEFAISYVEGGAASEVLFNITPGAQLNFSGPYGRLILREETIKRCFLMATGTGVTPYRAMLPQIKQKLAEQPDLEIWVLMGVQYRIDQLYPTDFLALAKEHPRFHYRVYHSRDELQEQQSYEHKGYVQTSFDELKPDAAHDVVYLCGNPNMIDDAYAILQELGFTAQQVRREKYVS